MKGIQKYDLSPVKFLKQTFFIWLFVIGHIAMIIFVSTSLGLIPINDLSFLNLIFGLFTIPSVVILFNYIHFSIGKKITISKSEIVITCKKNRNEITIKNAQIKRVVHVSNSDRISKFPWLFHEHLIIDYGAKKNIVFTSYQMDISSFKIDSLLFNRFSHKISTSEKKFFPIIRPNITQAMTTRAELLQNIDKNLLIESILEYRKTGKELMFRLGTKYGLDISEEEDYSILVSRSDDTIQRFGALSKKWNYAFHGGECGFHNEKTGQDVEVKLLNAPEFGIIEAWFLLSFLKSTEAYKSLAKDLDWQKLDGILNQLYATNEIKEIKNNDLEF